MDATSGNAPAAARPARRRSGRLAVRTMLRLALVMMAGLACVEAVSLQSFRDSFYRLLVVDQSRLVDYIARDLDKSFGRLSAEQVQLLTLQSNGLALADLGMLSSFCHTVIGQSGYLFLANSEGRLIVHPDRARLLQRAYPPGANAAFERALQGEAGTGGVTGLDGRRYITSFRRVAASGWIVAAVLPEQEAFAAYDKLVGELVVALIGVCAIVMALVFLLIRHLLGRLERVNLRLQAMRQEAVRTLRTRSLFFQEASHDFKQRLHALQLLVQVAGESPAAETAHQLRKVAGVVGNLKIYVNDFLEYTQLETTGAVPVRRRAELQDLFQHIDVLFEDMACEREVALKIRVTRAAFVTDERLLLRMLENLVSNAIKYGRGKVLLAARRRHGRLSVEVWDNGPGIPEASQARVFEAFHRTKDRLEQADGVGLGLAIVKRLAACLGYQIEVYSVPGRCNCIRIHIPC